MGRPSSSMRHALSLIQRRPGAQRVHPHASGVRNTLRLFETLQKSTDPIAKSSFSEEDLPSNTLGFYRAARGWSRTDIEQKADAWNVPRSLSQFQGYTFGVEYTHQATRLPAGGKWPADFSTIQPEPAGTLWQKQFLQT